MAEKEYIERDKAVNEVIKNPCLLAVRTARILEAIEAIPAADVVEVRHEKWVNNHCTGCGMMPLGEEIWTRLGLTPPKFEWFMDFCPICGARMDGERKEQK